MRFDTTLVQVAMCLASWSSVTAAWPDSFDGTNNAIEVRQDKNDENQSQSKGSDEQSISKAPAASKTSDGETKETGKDKDENKDNKDDKDSKDKDEKTTDKDKVKGTPTKTTSSARRTKFPATAVPGGVTMITPNVMIEPTPLYKVGEKVTLQWNYTSLKGTPSAIDVMATCSDTQQLYTLAANMTFKSPVTFTWDSNEQATDPSKPLATALYKLIIKDSDSDLGDAPEPGYLQQYDGLSFGMYKPADATPLSDFFCTGCNAGNSLYDRPALGLLVSMSLVSMLSFTWFVTGLGVF